MTTPARNQDSETQDSVLNYVVSRDEYHDGSIGPTTYDSTGLFTQGANRDIRPASVTSPVRNDGTRAPLPFDHRWGRFVNGYWSVTIKWPLENRDYVRRFSGAPIVGAATMSEALSRCGASWCNPYPGSFPYAAEALARTNFRNAVVDGRVEWGVTLGEMRETLRGIRTYAQNVLDLVEYLAKKTRQTKRAVVETILGIPPRTRKTPPWYKGKDRVIIDQWLAYQFAAKPLLNDIQESGEALSDLLFVEHKRMLMTIKRGGSQHDDVVMDLPGYPMSGPFLGVCDVTISTQCHISCVFEVVPTASRTLQQLGLTNPIGVAWELTTLSWAADYVSNMGKWLQSLASIEGAQFVEGSISRIMRVQSDGSGARAIPQPPYVLAEGSLQGIPLALQAGRFQREVLGETPTPALSPAWKNRMNLTRTANVLAALTKLVAS